MFQAHNQLAKISSHIESVVSGNLPRETLTYKYLTRPASIVCILVEFYSPQRCHLDLSRCPLLHKSLQPPVLQTERVVIQPKSSGCREVGMCKSAFLVIVTVQPILLLANSLGSAYKCVPISICLETVTTVKLCLLLQSLSLSAH